jgi:hypothetical protein
MPQDSLREHEQAVERARAKLDTDLATLRAPETFARFTNDLKREAFEAKDRLLEQAKSSAESSFRAFVEDLKGRAAANPAAAVAIGAGLAWHLLRKPPIASTLFGLGMISLWRTRPVASDDYLAEGRRRLTEQAAEAASKVAEFTKDTAERLPDTLKDFADAAKQKALGLTDEAGVNLSQQKMANESASNARDTVLLGIASAAVAAAVAISYQKRA